MSCLFHEWMTLHGHGVLGDARCFFVLMALRVYGVASRSLYNRGASIFVYIMSAFQVARQSIDDVLAWQYQFHAHEHDFTSAG